MDMPQFVYHSSVDRHLDCFQFRIITNNASKDIYVKIFVRKHIFLSLGQIYLSGISRSWDKFLFNFERNLYIKLFSKLAVNFTFPSAMDEASKLFTFSPTLVNVLRFYYIFFGGVAAIIVRVKQSHCSFDLHFLNDPKSSLAYYYCY